MEDVGTPLPLEERLERAARSQAVSPEAAAAMVRRFAALPPVHLFFRRPDLDTMNELTGEFWEDPRVEVDSYRNFCPLFWLALEHDNPLAASRPEDYDPYRPVWGARVNDALVLLGLLVLDHAMGRTRRKEVYRCTRMTLGQYLDATAALGPRRDSAAELAQWWREGLLRDYDGGLPLAEALAAILRRYMDGWQTLDRVDHILRCMGGLSLHLELERAPEAEAARRCRLALRDYGIGGRWRDLPQADPESKSVLDYYLHQIRHYRPDLPDPGGDLAPGALRGQIFLSRRDYHPDTLAQLAGMLPFPEFREAMEAQISHGRLEAAMEKISRTATDLYMLWVEPYLETSPRR